MNYCQTWRGVGYVSFTLDDVAEWANIRPENVTREIVREYVWDAMVETGIEEIEYIGGE